MSEDPKPQITLEQLLKLKKEEQPPEEFWEDFDREFQRRRLRALVERGEEGSGPLQWMIRFLYAFIPVSVTAAAAMGFILFHGASQEERQLSRPDVANVSLGDAGSSSRVSLTENPAPAGTAESRLSVVSASWESLPSDAPSRFIMDSLPASGSNGQSERFRMVQHSPLLKVRSGGSMRYVADPITVKKSDAMTVSFRPSSDF